MSFVYIASPYTHTDPEVMLDRYNKVKHATAVLLGKGVQVYSPILHNHQMALDHDMPKESDFWRRHNYAMLSKATYLYVLTLDGYEESQGVKDEIAFADLCSIEAIYVSYNKVISL